MGKYKVVGLDGTVVWSGTSWDHLKTFAYNQGRALGNEYDVIEDGRRLTSLEQFMSMLKHRADRYKCFLYVKEEGHEIQLTADEFLTFKGVAESIDELSIFCPTLEAGTLGDISEEEVGTL